MTIYTRITKADLSQLYVGSLFNYASSYVFGEAMVGENLLKVQDISTGNAYNVIYDPELFKPILARLGMVNTGNSAFYAQRRPSRNYSVGLTSANIRVSRIGSASVDSGVRYEALSRANSKHFIDCFNNRYPSLEEALAKFEDRNVQSVAFDKQFAVSRVEDQFRIYYRLTPVGWIEDGKIVFNKSYAYLKGALNGNVV